MKLIFTGRNLELMLSSIVNAVDDATNYDLTPFGTDIRTIYFNNPRAFIEFEPDRSPSAATRKLVDGFKDLIWRIVDHRLSGKDTSLNIQADAAEARRRNWVFDQVLRIEEVDTVVPHYPLGGRIAVKVGQDFKDYIAEVMPAVRIDGSEQFQSGLSAASSAHLDADMLTSAQKRFLADYIHPDSFTFYSGDPTSVGIRWGSNTNEPYLELDTETRGIAVKDDFHGDAILLTNRPWNDVYIEELHQKARETWRNNVLAGRRNLVAQERAEQERKKQIREKSRRNYENYRITRTKAAYSHDLHIDTLPIQNRGTKASRRWGIEIETGAGRDLSGTPSGWESKGDGSLVSAYDTRYVSSEDCYYAMEHAAPETVEVYERSVWSADKFSWVTETADEHNGGEPWEVANDDYIDPVYCDECGEISDWDDYDSEDCVELVSPILTSFHSNGLKQITDDLEDKPITTSAGVHVHVEAIDLNVTQVRHLLLAYDHLEPLIEASYRREERGYCKRRSAGELMQIVHSVDDDPNAVPKRMSMGDRYVTVNLQALAHHGTIEFRAMGPVYNYDTLVRWAMFCREMVNTVKNGATAKEWNRVKDWAGVEAMFAKYGVEYARATKLEAAPRVRTLAQV